MTPYEDVSFQEMKLAELEAEITDQDDAPNPEQGNKYIGTEVLVTRGYRYQSATVAH